MIDNIFINTRKFGSYSDNLTSEISDHFYQFAILKDFLRNPPSNQSDSFERNYKFFNNDEFKNDLKNIPWHGISKYISASPFFDVFSDQISALIN